MSNHIAVFFSWASENKNKSVLQKSIEEALFQLNQEQYKGYVYDYEEATRNLTGSPDIIESIKTKIRNAAVFICDITHFYSYQSKGKKSPNPNVIFEYGYALSIIGEERCILIDDMVYDNKWGNYTKAFDISKNRYSLVNSSEVKNTNKKILDYIRCIVDKNPQYPLNCHAELECDKQLAHMIIYDLNIMELPLEIEKNYENRLLKASYTISLDHFLKTLQEPQNTFFDSKINVVYQEIISTLEAVRLFECQNFFSSNTDVNTFVIEKPSCFYKDYKKLLGVYYNKINQYRQLQLKLDKEINEFRKAVKVNLYF